MTRAGAWRFCTAVVVSLGGLLGCDGSTAGVSAQTDASADAAPDAWLPDASPDALPDGELADVVTACPSQQPSGACSGSSSCNYGCTACDCAGGAWSCGLPQCPAACLGIAPNEGDPCVSAGGCCPGISVGDTCAFACDGGAGSATCEFARDASAAAWHVSLCPDTLDGGVDGAPE
jgi:hypothetical protein